MAALGFLALLGWVVGLPWLAICKLRELLETILIERRAL
jgi:hypothetical protein